MQDIHKLEASFKMIDGLIDFVTPSEEAISLHESGHACGALLLGVPPISLEFIDTPNQFGRARNPIPILSQDERRFIACAGYAVELNLFKSHRLTDEKGAMISEKAFIDIAIGRNADKDKEQFFGGNFRRPDGFWPVEMDREFMLVAKELASHIPMSCVFDIAEALLIERRLECTRLIAIATPHLPDRAPSWKCAQQ